MTPARFDALAAALNLGEQRIADLTGYTRDAVKNWRRRGRVWPPFAAWLETVGPQVAQILERNPPPNRNRQAAPAASPELVAAVLASLPPPKRETREARQAAIAAERAARAAPAPEVRPEALDTAGRRMFPRSLALIDAELAKADAVIAAAPAGPPSFCSRCGRSFRGPRCRCEAA